MAWQLIYTSAPRLLEAGRTGFGTVARHRAVSGMLASSVERFSQFARLPGHDTRRVVHAHRILTVGSGTFHVLSCLQDAGSDYTGRTNHIAHHLIAEPREIRALAASGITPADILLGMAWRSSWSEGPRFLDAAEEVDLSSFSPPASHAWSSVTGTPASAGILWSREALKGCYILLPAGLSALQLFRESLHAEPAQAWQTRFTTCLEPNDDLADFRWVALSATSPMRAQVETSSRIVFDLTRPATLPPPPERALPSTAPEDMPHQPPAAAQAYGFYVPAPSHPEQAPEPAPSLSSMGDWTPEPRQKTPKTGKSYIGASLVIAGVLVLIVVGALLRQDNLQDDARTDYEDTIRKTWTDYKLDLGDTRKLLEAQADLVEGKVLLQAHTEFFRSMWQVLQKPEAHLQLQLPAQNQDDLQHLKTLLDEWTALHANPWAKLHADRGPASAVTILAEFRRWNDSRAAKWKQLGEYVRISAAPPAADGLVQHLRTEAKEALRRSEPARGSRPSWEQLFSLLSHPKNAMDSEVSQWLHLWAKLDSPDNDAYALAKQAATNNALPQWLQAKAAGVQAEHDKSAAKTLPTKQPHPENAQPAKSQVAFEDADAATATNPLYVCLLRPSDDLEAKVKGLPVDADMQLYVGAARDPHPRPAANTSPPEGSLQKWLSTHVDGDADLKFGPSVMASLEKMILFSKDTLKALPEEYRKSPAGVRIVARSKDNEHVLFDLRLLPVSGATSQPVFPQTMEARVDNADIVTLSLISGILPRLHLLGLTNPSYSLRRDGSAADQKFFILKLAGDSAFIVQPQLVQPGLAKSKQALEDQIKEREQGIAKDDHDLAENEVKNEVARIKDEKREKYTMARAKKELEIQQLRAQLQELETQTPVHFDLMPGQYTLLLDLTSKVELCRLNVVPASAPSKSQSPNP